MKKEFTIQEMISSRCSSSRTGPFSWKYIFHIVAITAVIYLLLSCLGCANLMHKAVVVDSNVKALKVTMNDPSSSNPLPQIIIGFGRGCLVDMPMQDGAEVFYYCEDAAIFSGSMSGKTVIYMKAGEGVLKGHIKVEVEDGKILDIPFFKVYNPFGTDKEIKIDGR